MNKKMSRGDTHSDVVKVVGILTVALVTVVALIVGGSMVIEAFGVVIQVR
jgi:hypothetical protein